MRSDPCLFLEETGFPCLSADTVGQGMGSISAAASLLFRGRPFPIFAPHLLKNNILDLNSDMGKILVQTPGMFQVGLRILYQLSLVYVLLDSNRAT